METTKKSQIVGIKNAGIVIICCFIIAVCIYHFLLGNPSNFMNNDPNNHPLPGNFLGTIYKGGIIVPVIQTLLLTVLALSIERYFALRSAFGKGSLAKFVANIKAALAAGDIKKASEIPCDKAIESAPPPADNAANERIIPITVPSNPINVPKVVIVAIIGRFCCIIGISSAVASSSSF